MFAQFRSLRVATTVLTLSFLAACSSKKDDATPTPAATTGMSWTVDNNNVTAASTQKTVSNTSITISGGTGASNSGNVVQLTVPKATGTYNLASSSSTANATYAVSSGSTGTAYLGTSGTIIVTALTATNITGTFTFTGQELLGTGTKTISNGKFNIAL